jgi:hypothetical protein
MQHASVDQPIAEPLVSGRQVGTVLDGCHDAHPGVAQPEQP